MSELSRAVQDELDAHRPTDVPPFSALLARRRRRDRRRYAAAGLSVVALAVGVAGVVRAPDPDRLPTVTSPTGESRTYTLLPSVMAPEIDVDSQPCLGLPGVTDVLQLQSLPVQYRLTVEGREQQEAFERCISAVVGVYVPEIASDAAFVERCVGRQQLEFAPEYVGLTEAEATPERAAPGAPPVTVVRVFGRDGECIGGTRDFRADRVNVIVRDGRVVWAGRF